MYVCSQSVSESVSQFTLRLVVCSWSWLDLGVVVDPALLKSWFVMYTVHVHPEGRKLFAQPLFFLKPQLANSVYKFMKLSLPCV